MNINLYPEQMALQATLVCMDETFQIRNQSVIDSAVNLLIKRGTLLSREEIKQVLNILRVFDTEVNIVPLSKVPYHLRHCISEDLPSDFSDVVGYVDWHNYTNDFIRTQKCITIHYLNKPYIYTCSPN